MPTVLWLFLRGIKIIKIIYNKDVNKAFQFDGHQYFAGDLKRKQQLQHIHDDNANIGIGYHKVFESEQAHYHEECTEYEYVVKGQAKYLDLDNNIEYTVHKGDFFMIEPNTKYVMKGQKGSKILFFKNSTSNDKIVYRRNKKN